MTEEIITPDKASFNQAQYQQIRIHEILLRIDRLNTNPLAFSEELQDYNYKIVFRGLCSIFETISAKLSEKEKKDGIAARGQLDGLILTKLIYQRGLNWDGRRVTFVRMDNWNLINNALFNFRIRIEGLMDIHGYGNPTKDDPRKSVFKGV